MHYLYPPFPSPSFPYPPLPSLPPLHSSPLPALPSPHLLPTFLLAPFHLVSLALLPHLSSLFMHACPVYTHVHMQDLRLLLNLLTFSVPLPWCVSTTLPTHGVALLGYLSPLLALTTLIVYSIM